MGNSNKVEKVVQICNKVCFNCAIFEDEFCFRDFMVHQSIVLSHKCLENRFSIKHGQF